MTCPHCHPWRPRGLHCDNCGAHIFVVQDRDGQRFAVDHYGKLGCPR